jgi:hypothetical protein
MAADKIPQDSTIATVWTRLTYQRRYVAGVLVAMRKCLSSHGNASVRIGITGSGQKPYYRIFATSDDGVEEIFGSYYDNHEPLENAFAQTYNWSRASMTFKELEDFFAAQTGYAGTRPRQA